MKTVNDILRTAKAWHDIGCKAGSENHKKILDIYNNHRPLARNYKVKATDAWCATFISALFIDNNCVSMIGGTECSCGRMVEKMKTAGIWIEDQTKRPKIGDIIFYDWDRIDGWPEHVGIVESVNATTAVVIEGNYSNTVKRRTIALNSKSIRGYGRPKYGVATTSKTNELIAKEVLAGKWGNGATRRKNLINAGYDPDVIQQTVNKLAKR